MHNPGNRENWDPKAVALTKRFAPSAVPCSKQSPGAPGAGLSRTFAWETLGVLVKVWAVQAALRRSKLWRALCACMPGWSVVMGGGMDRGRGRWPPASSLPRQLSVALPSNALQQAVCLVQVCRASVALCCTAHLARAPTGAFRRSLAQVSLNCGGREGLGQGGDAS